MCVRRSTVGVREVWGLDVWARVLQVADKECGGHKAGKQGGAVESRTTREQERTLARLRRLQQPRTRLGNEEKRRSPRFDLKGARGPVLFKWDNEETFRAPPSASQIQMSPASSAANAQLLIVQCTPEASPTRSPESPLVHISNDAFSLVRGEAKK